MKINRVTIYTDDAEREIWEYEPAVPAKNEIVTASYKLVTAVMTQAGISRIKIEIAGAISIEDAFDKHDEVYDAAKAEMNKRATEMQAEALKKKSEKKIITAKEIPNVR